MSETQKMQVELKEEDRKLLRSVIDALAQPKPVEQAHAVEVKPKVVGHDTVEEMLSCPDCGKKAVEKVLAPLHGQRIVKCKGCGTFVGEKTEKCPSCGNTAAE